MGVSAQLNAQVPRTIPMQKQNIKVISPSEQTNIRNSLSTLKIQSVQLCDSVALLQRKISDAVKELQSGGASDETIKAMVMQEKLDYISKMMAMLSNLSKAMHETSKSIIQNMK